MLHGNMRQKVMSIELRIWPNTQEPQALQLLSALPILHASCLATTCHDLGTMPPLQDCLQGGCSSVHVMLGAGHYCLQTPCIAA